MPRVPSFSGEWSSNMRAPKPNQLYVLEWYPDGVTLKETIRKDDPMPRSVMRWKMKELRRTTHKTGSLVPKPIDS